MSGQSSNFDLCTSLLRAEKEEEVIELLQSAGYWKNDRSWRLFGDRENNFSIIGNQQANPVYAIVEKLVNSVDAVLMRECLREGVDPESHEAPESIAEALERYFDIKDGNLANIGAWERSELAENIGMVATGQKRRPNYIVFDRGEGQTPANMSKTFLSLAESNKLKIPFVQGKFNMGGSGVLRFCGDRHLNLIISRRDPHIEEPDDGTADLWGFTVVKREDPRGLRKNSVYTYLAPGDEILTFTESAMRVPEYEEGTQGIESIEWGSIIKLYEYEMSAGLKTNILFDLYNQISLLLPRAGHPVRFYERRGYAGHTLETTMSGLHVRLEEDKRDNVEEGFPTDIQFGALDQELRGTIYAFKHDSSGKYRKNEGILFTSNGQTHGHIPQSFFTRKRVGMSYLADSLLVIVECDLISRRAREVLFMNSRDRLSEGDLRREIERELESILSNHPGLRALRERRRREAVDSKLADSKPLKDVLNEILVNSPSLTALFAKGADIPNPFKSRLVGEEDAFEGKPHPTFFTPFPGHEDKHCHINQRFRLQFETDVENDYFGRDRYPGTLKVMLNGKRRTNFVRNLWNGVATLTIPLPAGTEVGDTIQGHVIVEDETLIKPFKNEFSIHVQGPYESHTGGNGRRKPRGGGKGDRISPEDLDLPHVTEVREEDWHRYDFDKFSALKAIHTGHDGYDFHLNMDNIFLRTELKSIDRSEDAQLTEARFKYGMVLLGLAILKDRELFEESDASEQDAVLVEKLILDVTRSFAPVLVPMVDALGSLKLDDIMEREDAVMEYE